MENENVEDDSMFATGVSSLDLFPVTESEEENKQVEDSQVAEIRALIPTAKENIADLDREIAETNRLTNFVEDLQRMPSDVPEIDIRAKIESRYAYINMLLRRRATYMQALENSNQTFDDVAEPPILPQIIFDSPKIVPQQRGWKAIWLGIRDLFGVSPM